jgi:hypothetical protein
MAVIKETFTDTGGSIKITNGDFNALKEIVTAYHLKDEADAIAYALGVLSQTDGKGVFIEKDGMKVRLIPSDKLTSATHG